MNVPYCLRHAARFHGGRIAIEHEGRRVSYREFAGRVSGVAAGLRDWGVKKNDRVAVWMRNGPEYLELYFAAALAGGVIVPLNTRWSEAEIGFVLRDSESRLAMVDEAFAERAAALTGTVETLEAALTPESLGVGEVGEGFEEPAEDGLAGLFYTSGTTGGPKGAMLTHRNLFANAMSGLASGIFVATRWLHAAPMFHIADAGAILGLTVAGSCHCFVPGFDAEGAMAAIERHRITGLLLVPTMINMLVNHPCFGRHDLSSLERLSYGASPMPLPLLREAMAKLKCAFAQGYGMTEASGLLTVLAPEDHRLEGAKGGLAPALSAGKPVVGVEVRVVDEEDRDVAAGEVGEVIARGANVMKGYWNRPEATADVLRGGWLHTGDMGMFDEEGFLYIRDRKKDMIKTGGENVYSPEVEAAILGHEAVLEAAVIGMADERWGETIRAVVVVREGMALSEGELIEHCRGRLTHFKCPRSAVFTDALPKGGTGKVQKNALRERFGAVL